MATNNKQDLVKLMKSDYDRIIDEIVDDIDIKETYSYLCNLYIEANPKFEDYLFEYTRRKGKAERTEYYVSCNIDLGKRLFDFNLDMFGSSDIESTDPNIKLKELENLFGDMDKNNLKNRYLKNFNEYVNLIKWGSNNGKDLKYTFLLVTLMDLNFFKEEIQNNSYEFDLNDRLFLLIIAAESGLLKENMFRNIKGMNVLISSILGKDESSIMNNFKDNWSGSKFWQPVDSLDPRKIKHRMKRLVKMKDFITENIIDPEFSVLKASIQNRITEFGSKIPGQSEEEDNNKKTSKMTK